MFWKTIYNWSVYLANTPYLFGGIRFGFSYIKKIHITTSHIIAYPFYLLFDLISFDPNRIVSVEAYDDVATENENLVVAEQIIQYLH